MTSRFFLHSVENAGSGNGGASPKKASSQAPEATRRVEVIAPVPTPKRKLSVAGYCRVSTDLPSQESSIENQRKHYRSFIEANPEWQLADIYWETGVSGTKTEERPELQRLLADCRAGRVDMIVTKSISRFSRNTADCLALVRMLVSQGIILYFEKENIRTDRMDSEFLLTVLAAFSQDESRAISDNMKWAIRKRFQAGTYRAAKAPYGYRRFGDRYAVDEEEAAVVRAVFASLAAGKGSTVVARELNSAGVPTWSAVNEGRPVLWSSNRIRQIVKNRFYIGETVYQKTYRDTEYRQRINRGELDSYIYQDAHPAIVDRELFRLANAAIERNRDKYGIRSTEGRRTGRSCFSGKLFCGVCGGKMYRGGSGRPFYLCQRHARTGDCPMGPVAEAALQSAFASLLNKLAFAQRCGLLLTAEPGERESRLASEARAENRRKRGSLYGRMQAEKQTSELLAEKAALENEALILEERKAKPEPEGTEALRRHLEQRGLRSVFTTEGELSDADAFAAFAEKAVIRKGDWIEFRLRCGLSLRETFPEAGASRRTGPPSAAVEFVLTETDCPLQDSGFAARAAELYERIVPLRRELRPNKKER